MTKTQHTPPAILALPYELSDPGIIYGAPKADDSSTFVADLELEESSEEQVAAERARGEFIVKVCNVHYELVAALEEAREHIDGEIDVVDGDDGQPAPNRAMRLAQIIDAALAKAAGGAA